MTIPDLTNQIQLTKTLKDIAQSYTEISSVRLRRIRKQTEESRVFFHDLSTIFGILQHTARQKNSKLKTLGNEKTAIVLITSNFRFYGKISSEATELFLRHTQNESYDQIVIGKLGIEFLKGKNYSQPFQKLIFTKDIPNHLEMNQLISLIKDYSRVLVVYSEFKTILNQSPTIRDLTQTQIEALSVMQNKKPDYTFILEPEIEKMIQFFDAQIKNVLLFATFLEAELSRVASRLISMDQAQSNAKGVLNKQQQELIFAKRALFNKKTLETWSAIRARQLMEAI